MANNRIYLKCNVCGEMLFLGKSYIGYYWENYGKLNGDPDSPPLEDRLNEFFKKHTFCNNEGNDGDYSIEYESPFRDTVEVVRCKNCLMHGVCRLEQRLGMDGYCSEAERREE